MCYSFAVNYLLVEALDTYALFCDDLMTSHHVTGRGGAMSLLAAATDIRRRLVSIFLLNSGSQRPLHAGLPVFLSHCLILLGLI